MDQMGEVEYAPGEPKGTPWHPHRGFETVTYMIDGVMDHQDSQGGGGSITNGDTQWMTAGSGMLHIETPPEWLVASGGLFHGVQLWVNLPREQKWAAPRYQDLRSSQLGLVTTSDAGALVRVIAGEVGGLQGPGSTHTPMAMVHGPLGARRPPRPAVAGRLQRPRLRARRLAARWASRPGRCRRASSRSSAGATSSPSARPTGRTAAPATMEVLVLGGRPIREPVAWGGPFVMNTKAEVLAGLRGLPEGPDGAGPGGARALERRTGSLSIE